MKVADLVHSLGIVLEKNHYLCSVAESCTGGLIAAAITTQPGSSAWFDCGFITYSNTSKHALLGVSPNVLNTYGAVSSETVLAMAEGALHHSSAQISVAVSGIAGPNGGSPEKPVGTVWFAWAGYHTATTSICHHLTGTRTAIRKACVSIALQGLLSQIK